MKMDQKGDKKIKCKVVQKRTKIKVKWPKRRTKKCKSSTRKK